MGNQFILEKIYKGLKPAQKIALSFLLVILVGAVLLSLPISNTNGEWLNPIDAIFTACSATCVTGLVVRTTATAFSTFGHLVILIMIQIGGLGLMTLVASFIVMLKSKLSMNNRIAMLEMLNQSNIGNFKAFLVGILKYTFIMEAIGAVILMTSFIPKFGMKGIWISIFTAISAFCNAGFDIIGHSSLQIFVKDPIISFTIMALIIFGGLGFAVWFDCKEKLIKMFKEHVSFRKAKHSLNLHTKFVIVATLILIFLPALIILIIEFNNPATLGDLNIFEKIMASLFESVTFRTAGFETIANSQTLTATRFLGCLCMFIGGSPGGTAGGIKTTTIAVIIACVICRLRGQTHTDVFGRHISREIIVRATMIIVVNVTVLFTGIFLLSIIEPFDFNRLCFEASSALGTVGLSAGITPLLSTGGKIIIIMLMYVGRIGIMTFLMSISHDSKKIQNRLDLPEGHIMVG